MLSLTWTRRTRRSAHGPKSRSGRPPARHTASLYAPTPFVTTGKQDKTGDFEGILADNALDHDLHVTSDLVVHTSGGPYSFRTCHPVMESTKSCCWSNEYSFQV
jgi:hypothetical protein